MTETTSRAGLRDIAAAAELSIGSAAHHDLLASDPDYARVLAHEFDSITPYTAMKWGVLHPEPDRYDFSGGDAIVEFATANQMRIRGHTLVWGGATDPPNPAYIAGVTSEAELREAVESHIATVVGRWAGRIDRWDVVNEPLTVLGDPGRSDGLRENVFLDRLGARHIADALRLAHEVDPGARLFVNDFFVLAPGPKQERYFRLVRDLLDVGAPLHGVGFQGHLCFLPAAPPGAIDLPSEDAIATTLGRFAELGLDVEITELNVHTWRFDGDRGARLAKQREVYRRALRAATSVPRCRAVTVWLFTDRHPTSMERFVGRSGEPLLFDADYRPKPAYFGVREALLLAAQRTGAGGLGSL